MAGELKHQSVGAELTQAEFESVDLHQIDGVDAGLVIAGKVDKVSGSSLVSDALIAEIHAPGSDNQIIPTNLSDLTDDATHRLTTDTEKASWNGKQSPLGYTPVPDTRLVNSKRLNTDITLTQDDMGNGVTYKLYSATEQNNLSAIHQVYRYGLSTGIITRGVISINSGDGTKIDITAATSLYVDDSDPANIIVEVLSLPQQTAILPPTLDTQDRLWIGIQRVSAGVGGIIYSQQFTPQERRTIAILGRVWANGSTTIEGVGQYATPAWGYEKTLEDLMACLGSINYKGNVFTAHDDSLTLDKSSGQSFRFGAASGTDMNTPNIVQDAGATDISAYHYHLAQDATGNTTLLTAIDPDHYDVAGTLTPVPDTKFTIQRVYLFPRSEVVDITYGQAVYDSMDQAVTGIGLENFTISDMHGVTLYGSILRAYICVKKGTTSLSDTDCCKIVSATTFGAGGTASGVTGLQLGETSTEAYRGDRGKIAYDYSQSAHAPVDAEKNVQADWNEADTGADDFIKNKPSIPTQYTDNMARAAVGTIPSALSALSDDSTHRLVTDTEIGTWNGKQSALGFTPLTPAQTVGYVLALGGF